MPAEPPPEPLTGGSDKLTPDPDEAMAAQGGATLPRSEQELNSPTPLTLRLLGVIFVATFLPWVGAKAACNLRDAPPRPPLPLATAELAKQPKSAALELQQRAASHQYRQAAELAKNELAAELLAADARCHAEPKPCEERRAMQDRIFTRAVLVSRGPSAAVVRAQTLIGDQVVGKVAMRLSREEDGRWYVVSRTPLAGELDDPVSPDEVVAPFEIRPSPDQRRSPHSVVIQGASVQQEPPESSSQAPR